MLSSWIVTGSATRIRTRTMDTVIMSRPDARAPGLTRRARRRAWDAVTRPATGSARGLKCALLRARGRTVAARAASHANALATIRVQTRSTRPSTQCLLSVLTHASSLSESIALSRPPAAHAA